MIIRSIDRPSATLLTRRIDAPAGVRGVFGLVEVLQLTSFELRETFGISLAELDVETPFELAAALTHWRGEPTAAHVRKDRLVRLIGRRPDLLPCFVGYQEVSGLGVLPFMSDGPTGKWSLFMEEDGRMTLVEARENGLVATPDTDLIGPSADVLKPVRAAKSFLFGGFRADRGHARDDERRVIRIGANGNSRSPRRH
jgi:hypothetical protein